VARLRLATSLSKEEVERAIWLDVEMRKADEIPAISGWMIENEYQVAVHDELLIAAAKEKGIRFIDPVVHFEELLGLAEDEGRVIVSYTSHEYNKIQPLSAKLVEGLGRKYVSASYSKWFERNIPELFEKAQEKQKRKSRKKRSFKKKSGYTLGLKDFLKLDEIGYPQRKKAGVGGAAKSIGEVREKAIKGSKLSKSEKTRWTNLWTYLEHDVRGLAHLTEFVVEYGKM
jgi:hypothetical protein